MRRMTLQISRPINRASTGSQPTPRSDNPSALSGLGAYQDSDSDSGSESGSDSGNAQNAVEDEDSQFAAFMADITATSASILEGPEGKPEVKTKQDLQALSLPIHAINPSLPRPVPQAVVLANAIVLPPFDPTALFSVLPKPSNILSKLDQVLARIDQLPAFPVSLPDKVNAEISERRKEFDCRCCDWRAGGLLDAYFDAVLTHWEGLVEDIESLYCPEGWQIHWDVSTESHYFQCLANDAVSWSWPEIPPANTSMSLNNPASIESSKLKPAHASATPPEPSPQPEPAISSEPHPSSQQHQKEKLPPVPKKLTNKPQVVSISAKSRKMATLLQKWHSVKAEVAAAHSSASEDEESKSKARDRKLHDWAAQQAETDSQNPNFAPLVPRNKKSRVDGLPDE
ncbi:hypothetical protein HDU81_010018 [Chytriomyces hyalinus]|nr:hypothetical protein HDU81_010018 [Chytriomyces hyalinus]